MPRPGPGANTAPSNGNRSLVQPMTCATGHAQCSARAVGPVARPWRFVVGPASAGPARSCSAWAGTRRDRQETEADNGRAARNVGLETSRGIWAAHRCGVGPGTQVGGAFPSVAPGASPEFARAFYRRRGCGAPPMFPDPYTPLADPSPTAGPVRTVILGSHPMWSIHSIPEAGLEPAISS